MRRTVLLTALAGWLLAAPAANATVLGELDQLEGTAGCVADGAAEGCRSGRALAGATDLVVSPDGRFVYAVSANDDAVVGFRRAPSGALTPIPGLSGCVRRGGGEGCSGGRALDRPTAVAISPDGRSLHVASAQNAIATFARNTQTGEIAQLVGPNGCVAETGLGGTCLDGHALKSPRGLATSASGDRVYVAAAGSNAVAILTRSANDGRLTQVAGDGGCISNTGVGPCKNGHHLRGATDVAVSGARIYVAATNDHAVSAIRRNGAAHSMVAGDCASDSGSGGCRDARALRRPVAVAASSSRVYVAAQETSSLVTLAAGSLEQPQGEAGCISEFAREGCNDHFGLTTPFDLAITDGSGTGAPSAYAVAANGGNGGVLSTFEFDQIGALRPLGVAEFKRCIQDDTAGVPDTACLRGRGLGSVRAVAVARDGRSVYTAASSDSALAAFERNLPPSCFDAAATVPAGASTQLTLDCQDPNGTSLSFSITQTPGHGTLFGSTAQVSYTPAPGFEGADGFRFRARESSGAEAGAGFTLKVSDGNPSAPICQDTTRLVGQGEPTLIGLPCSDADGDPLAFTIVTPPVRGVLGPPKGFVQYTPGPEFGVGGAGDSFTFRAGDGALESATQTAQLVPSPGGTALVVADRTAPDLVLLTRRVRLRRSTVLLRFGCPTAEAGACLARISVRSRGRVLGRGTYNAFGGRKALVRVRLRGARRLLAHRRRVTVTVAGRLRDVAGHPVRKRRRLVVLR